jgi:hypothetical protein
LEQTGKEFFLFDTEKVKVDVVGTEYQRTDLLRKKLDFHKQGVLYLPFFENEVTEHPGIFESIVKNKLGEISERVYARDLVIAEIDSKGAREFLEENHRQGEVGATVNVALLGKGNKIFSLMTFGRSRFSDNYEWELLRFCSKLQTVVVGAASKLFSYFIKKYTPKSIVSYCDLRFADLDPEHTVYPKLGFKFKHRSNPNYWYLKEGVMNSRVKFQKHKLQGLLQKFDPNLSEQENMQNNGYERLYDCGNFVFEWHR